MPPLPYSQGVPSVEPEVGGNVLDRNYLRIQSTPAEFGGLIGQGEQALGQGALKAGQFYGEVAADNATNQYMAGARKILFGDPDKPWLDGSGQPILDNDGKPQADRGLFGLQGDEAMRAAPQKIKALEDLRTQLGAGMLTGASALKFDAETRRMQNYHNDLIGRHVEAEAHQWAHEVEQAGIENHKLAIGQAALSGDWGEVAKHEKDLIGMHIRQASRLGGGNELLTQANNRGQIESKVAQIAATAPTNPALAESILNDNRGLLAGSGHYDALSNLVRGYVDREDREYDKAFVNQWLHDPNTPYNPPSGRHGSVGSGGSFRAPPGAPIEGANPVEQQMLNEIRHRESSNNYSSPPNEKDASGAYQFQGQTWKENTKKSGIGTEYARAVDAPQKVQDTVALWTLRNQGMRPWLASGPYPAFGGGNSQDELKADFAKSPNAPFGTPQEAAQRLTTVTAPGGASFQVHQLAAPQIQGFVNELAGLGYKIDPQTSGGYNNRNKVGVNTDEKSEHAFGSAIDINSDRNKQGPTLVTDLPSNIGEIAARWGLKWGGSFEGTKDAMHFEVARLLPGGDKPVQLAAQGGPASAIPIPPGTAAPQSTAVATARPDLESRVQEIEAGPFPDDVKNKLISAVRRQDSQWRLAHASDQRQLREDISNTTAALAAGKDVPPIPEDRIRTYAPNPVAADDWIEKQADAREIGQAFNNAKTMSLAEMGQTQARLDAAAAVPGIHDFRLRQRQAQLFQQARSKIIEGMVSDPVDYLSGNNEAIAADQESLRQLHSQANTPEGAAAYQAANTKYFGDLQAAQESFGLPGSMRHVLSKNEAQGQAQTLMTNPVQAPAAMRDMAQSYGAAWPSVWKDLVTVGKLPVAFQAAGILDDHYAMRLAEGLRDEIGTEGKKGIQVWDALLGQQRVSGISGIVNSVRSNPQMTPFIASMRTGRASVPEMDSFMHAVTTTALSLVAHEGLEDSDAVAKAVEAFTGLYGYMPNGGARVPIKQFDNVAAAADAAAEHWNADTIHFPVGIADHPGAPTKEDYLANIKAHPTWINGHDQVELIDSYGRHVMDAAGQPITIPFGVAAPVPRATDVDATRAYRAGGF